MAKPKVVNAAPDAESTPEPKKAEALVVFVNEKGRPTLHSAVRAKELLDEQKEKARIQSRSTKAHIVLPGAEDYEVLSKQATGAKDE